MAIEGGKRTRFAGHCPDCRGIIRETGGARECECRSWPFAPAERGTLQEEQYLEANGFRFAKDPSGELYYWRQPGYIIHLYANGRWDSDTAPTDCNYLEEYFALFRAESDTQ